MWFFHCRQEDQVLRVDIQRGLFFNFANNCFFLSFPLINYAADECKFVRFVLGINTTIEEYVVSFVDNVGEDSVFRFFVRHSD